VNPPWVTTWFLEMTSPEQLRPGRPVEGFEPRPLPHPDAALSRRMYDQVGGPWQWTDRLGWGIARWRAHLAQPGVHTWIGYLEGDEVGYAELARIGGDVEIASFGLLPGFAGRGMGGALLAAVTEAAWEDGAERVWLHTCSLDSPDALPAYEARGFRRYDERTGR
jgi:GNAT superfamily N-acetyltransferase